MELTEMTSIQQKAIPVLLQGHGVMVKSQTGSGEWTLVQLVIEWTLGEANSWDQILR